MATRWGIREEPSYEQACQKLGIEIKRLDEVLFGLTWLLARAADDDGECPEVDGDSGIRVAKARIPGTSDWLRVWFVLDSEAMLACLISIDVEQSSREEDDSW